MNAFKTFALFIGLALIVLNCKEKTQQNEAAGSAALEAFRSEVKAISDSLASYKALAFASETEKSSSALAMLEEVEAVSDSYDPKGAEELQEAIAKMNSRRYTDETMNNEEKMVAYDEACDLVLLKMEAFRRSVKDYDQLSRVQLLYNAVVKANRQDLFIRRDYNKYARKLNTLLVSEEEKLEALGGEFAKMEKAPLFYGEES